MVDLCLDHVDAEIRGRTDRFRALARGEQGLGGDATVIQAVAAHAALFDQHDRHAELRRRRCHRKAA